MELIAETILPSALRNRSYAEKLLQGTSAEQFAKKPDGIELNHAAFNCGHLAIYFPRILTVAGLSAEPAETPAHYFDLFKREAACHDDPAGTIYPPRDELAAAFYRGYDAVLNALQGASDRMLSIPLTDERMKMFFTTTGAALNYLLVNHVAQHLGQISAWRRCMGLPGLG